MEPVFGTPGRVKISFGSGDDPNVPEDRDEQRGRIRAMEINPPSAYGLGVWHGTSRELSTRGRGGW